MSFSERLQEIRTGFERPFWVANISELFERLSYYAVFAVLARYLHEGLHFDVERASSLTGMFGGWVWFLAIGGGALADRLGFRRALSIAYLILSFAYFLLGSIGSPWLAPLRNSVPLVALVAFVLILPALGVALVKLGVVDSNLGDGFIAGVEGGEVLLVGVVHGLLGEDAILLHLGGAVVGVLEHGEVGGLGGDFVEFDGGCGGAPAMRVAR